MKLRRSLSILASAAAILVIICCTPGKGDEAPAPSAGSVLDTPPAVSSPVLMPSKIPAPGQALLVRGSESVRGIAGFGRNAIPALFGEYALASASGGLQLVSVWFTRETLVLDEVWSPRSCPGLPAGYALAQSGPAGDGSLILVASTVDYRIVIHLPPDFGNPCRFIAVLIERLLFFMRNATREEDLSFPAFLQL